VADLEGGRAGSGPPLGDGQTPSLMVMLAMLNFDRSTVKHGSQHIQNDCHQWVSDSFRVHQIRFRPWLRSRPQSGNLTALPHADSLAGLRGPISDGGGRRGERERIRGDHPEMNGTGGTGHFSQIPASALELCLSKVCS